jgi:hypothetical protein
MRALRAMRPYYETHIKPNPRGWGNDRRSWDAAREKNIFASRRGPSPTPSPTDDVGEG